MATSSSTVRHISIYFAATFASLAAFLALYFIFNSFEVGIIGSIMGAALALLLLNQSAMSVLGRFLCLCGGADITTLEKCPTEFSKLASVGMTVLLTGVFATLSGGYAMYKIFNDLGVGCFFGLIWGIMIFNLDRYIVMSMRKIGQVKEDLNPDNSQPKQKKECKFLSLSQLEEKKIKNQHSKNDG